MERPSCVQSAVEESWGISMWAKGKERRQRGVWHQQNTLTRSHILETVGKKQVTGTGTSDMSPKMSVIWFRPHSHRSRDYSATSKKNVCSPTSWWVAAGWCKVKLVIKSCRVSPHDCFGCYQIAAVTCISLVDLIFVISQRVHLLGQASHEKEVLILRNFLVE